MKNLILLILLSSTFIFLSCSRENKTSSTKDSKVTTADFFKAVKNDKVAVVKEYLEKDKSLVNAIDSSSGINETALGITTYSGNKEMTELLIKNGANVNHQDAYGVAPLHGASRTNRVEVVKILIENKADVNLPTTSGKETPLHYAAKYNNPDVVKLLLTNNADKNIKDASGLTPYDAAKKDNADKVLDLLK